MSSSPLSDAAQGFMVSPETVLLVLLGLFLVVLILLAVFVLQNRRMRRSLELQSSQAWEKALGRLRLSPAERALVERLTALVSDPLTRRHLVLTNQNTFNHCASRLLATRGADEAALAALRVRLGFARSSSERPVTSTAILPAGLRLLVVQRETKKFYATVSESTSAGVTVRIEDPEVIAPGPGTPLRCYFNVKNGTFHFTTSVDGVDGQSIRIAHSEKITRTQRRKYYRARTDLVGRVGVAGSAETTAPARIFDLSGGGASLENPGFRFNPGDDLRIEFSNPVDGAVYRLIGEVKRLSHGGRTLHAVFGPMNDSMRDRLIAFVLSQRTRHLSPAVLQSVPRPPAVGS